jgi:hypothetical protein
VAGDEVELAVGEEIFVEVNGYSGDGIWPQFLDRIAKETGLYFFTGFARLLVPLFYRVPVDHERMVKGRDGRDLNFSTLFAGRIFEMMPNEIVNQSP